MDKLIGMPLGLKIFLLVYLGATWFIIREIRSSPVRNDWEHKAPKALSSPDE